MSAMIIKSRKANDLKLTAYHGHFATRHSHNSHYLDITRMKHECAMADIAAASLANHYVYELSLIHISFLTSCDLSFPCVLHLPVAFYVVKGNVSPELLR